MLPTVSNVTANTPPHIRRAWRVPTPQPSPYPGPPTHAAFIPWHRIPHTSHRTFPLCSSMSTRLAVGCFSHLLSCGVLQADGVLVAGGEIRWAQGKSVHTGQGGGWVVVWVRVEQRDINLRLAGQGRDDGDGGCT